MIFSEAQHRDENGEYNDQHRFEFQGQDAEVSVERTGGKIEGGWEVVGTSEKDGTVVVCDNKGKKETMSIEKLLKLQPFQKGESVPVIRTNGKLDREGWKVSKRGGYGFYEVEKMIDGKSKTKRVGKMGLINAKIAELNWQRTNITDWGDVTVDDRRILQGIDDDLKYWSDKLKKATLLGN